MEIDRSYFDKYKVMSAYNGNPQITGYAIPVHSPDWYAFRETGFGASEIAIICGKNPNTYGKILPKLLEEKAGISRDETKLNEHMMSGILAEPIITERWRYYDGTVNGYVQNWQEKNEKRKCREVDMYLVNENFPWLFVSLDRSILKDQDSLVGTRLKEEHPLELKQISYFASQKWENGVPPQYVYQVHQQMVVCNVEYCELATLMDGYKFDVFPFPMDQEVAEEILTKSFEQWQVVIKMRELKQGIDHYKDINRWDKVEGLQAQLDSLLPLPDGNEGWKEFLSERYMQEKEEFDGKTADFKMVKQRQRLSVAMNEIEAERDKLDNKMRVRFVQEGAQYMSFGSSGKVRYFKRSNSKIYQLDFKGVKDKTSPVLTREMIEPLFDGIQ